MTPYNLVRWRSLLHPTRHTFRRAVCILLGLVFLVSAHGQETPDRLVYLAGSGSTALDQHIQSLLTDQLRSDVTLTPISDDQIPMIKNTPIVSIGPAAFSRVRQANRSIPILAMLVNKSFIEGFAARNPGQISGVFTTFHCCAKP